MVVPLSRIEFGVMQNPHKMVALHAVDEAAQATFMLDLQQKHVEVVFRLIKGEGWDATQSYKFRIDLAELKLIRVVGKDENVCFVVTVESPPMMFRKTTENTHERGSTLWDERQMWYRQTDIDLHPTRRQYPIGLQKPDAIIDIGRWLTFRFVFDAARDDATFRNIVDALTDSGVTLTNDDRMEFDVQSNHPDLWKWSHTSKPDPAQGSLNELQELANEIVHLSFPVRYALESCISHNLIHESNITPQFLRSLHDLNPITAVKILEKVVDEKQRYFEPHAALQASVSMCEKKKPGYCSKIPAVTVTPTTIYINTPALETSNRVVRKFKEYEDHFLRVKFTDERYRGRLKSHDGHAMDEGYSRIKQAMTHGIQIGDRRYDFLAFGNSQFREHGAYFFARTGKGANAITAEKIRKWMGEFSHIKVVAKYASRLGQCFSTTRAVLTTPEVKEIPDIQRNGYTFTDGVGKISPLLAQLVKQYHGLDEVPSVVQFRLGGCKGVLTIDPALRGCEVHLRPSQQKFSADVSGLEICRVSRFSSAHLNVQIILVLSSRGVPDAAFLAKEKNMLKDLDEAMISVPKAKKLLRQNVDFNQTSLQLADMVDHGFMAAQEPFFMSCLKLWRAWNLKYLKQKAKIFIEKGALLLGTVDETGTLRGHFNGDPFFDLRTTRAREDHITSTLPQIFVQITDHVTGGTKVITGRCILLRNPSLHPGDARVVLAVDVPALHHIKNAIVMPQTGDRDLGNMSSGGDLDGDDYVVIWDLDLIPPEVNYPAMDYTAPAPVVSSGPVTVNDITNFFVTHIKNDNLGPIAVAHRYLADAAPAGVKIPPCLQLAQLHSKAVDYAKTGVPAEFPKSLRPTRWPHWSEQKHKAAHKIYHSKGIVGQLYDAVTLDPFSAASASKSLPFDRRIIDLATPEDEAVMEFLPAALDVKHAYDEALRRLMFQYGIKSEFEVWTTFVLEHSSDHGGDWKFAESLGEAFMALNHHFQDICYESAGTSRDGRDWSVLRPWIIAMYKVTADESRRSSDNGDQQHTTLISFPWLFPRELGDIANAEPPVVATPPSSKALSEVAVEETLPPLPVAGDLNLTSTSLRHDLIPPIEAASPAPPEDTAYDQFCSEEDLMYFSDEESIADGELQRESSPALILTPATSNSQPSESIRTSLDLSNEEILNNEEILASLFVNDETREASPLAHGNQMLACEMELPQSDDEMKSCSHGSITPASSASVQDDTSEQVQEDTFKEVNPPAIKDEEKGEHDNRVVQGTGEKEPRSRGSTLLDRLEDVLNG
jgi:RNA-dependent RNA polymerase